MNGEPHVHKPKIEHHDYAVLVSWSVTYGDTTVWCCRGPFLDRRLARAAAKAIHRHDRGSIKAQKREDSRRTVVDQVLAGLPPLHDGDRVDAWPSLLPPDVIQRGGKEPRVPAPPPVATMSPPAPPAVQRMWR